MYNLRIIKKMAKKNLQNFTILSTFTSNHLRMSTQGTLYREYSGVTVMGKCKTLFFWFDM